MKKAIVLLLIVAIAGFSLVSCIKDVVTYCVFCGKASIEEVSSFDFETGIKSVSYQCLNTDCGKKFGAARMDK